MKVVILAGGYGSRIADYSELPKPMIPIGKYPIIVHIMKIYIKYGFKDFIIPIGYKGKIIQNYFRKNKKKFKNCNIKIVNTGINSLTGTRLKKIKKIFNRR